MKRDPLKDPRQGDVLRWLDAKGDAVVCLVTFVSPTAVCAAFTYDHPPHDVEMTPADWSDGWGATNPVVVHTEDTPVPGVAHDE